MINLHAIEELQKKVIEEEAAAGKDVFVILVAGCSRAGKSTLSAELNRLLIGTGHQSLVVNIDSWLVDIDKRKPGSTVSERYDLVDIRAAVRSLIGGRSVTPPVYDPVSRKRLDDVTGGAIQIEKGFLIVEGVITLSDAELLAIADLAVFVGISDGTRIRRVIDFYSRIKKLPKDEYKKIIRDREKEEIPFVKSTITKADIVFTW